MFSAGETCARCGRAAGASGGPPTLDEGHGDDRAQVHLPATPLAFGGVADAPPLLSPPRPDAAWPPDDPISPGPASVPFATYPEPEGEGRRPGGSVANAVVLVVVIVALALVVAAVTVVVIGRDRPTSSPSVPVVTTYPSTTRPATTRSTPATPTPPGNQAPSSMWMTWQSPDKTLQVEFPGEPAVTEVNELSSCVAAATLVSHEEQPTIYELYYADNAGRCSSNQIVTELDRALGERSPDRRPANPTPSTFRGFPMTTFELTGATGAPAGYGVTIVTPTKVFVMTAAGPPGTTDIDRFVGSLRFTL